MSKHRGRNRRRSFSPLTLSLLLAVALPLRGGDLNEAPKTDAAKADAPEVQPKSTIGATRIKQSDKGLVVLQARDVVIHGTTVRYEPDKNTIGYWSKQSDWVSWELEIVRPGAFTVEMYMGCGAGSGGSHFTVEIADQKLSDKVPDTGSFHNFRVRNVGTVKIDKPGNYTLSVRASDKPGVAVMDLRSVTLTPTRHAE
jgi:arylsulfatase A